MNAISLSKFIADNPQKKIKADILERWVSRIVGDPDNPRNLHLLGERGAQMYIRDYAQTAGTPKLLQFGALAMQNGYPEFAAGFYKKAADLMGVEIYEEVETDTPHRDAKVFDLSDVGEFQNPMTPTQFKQAYEGEYIVAEPGLSEFPNNMQPGKFVPMQPVDAKLTRASYVADPRYWMQPKIDGNKLVVFATRDQVWYQTRSLRLTTTPDLDFERELKEAANYFDSFILEGELTFLDYEGKEHRTGSQAATANAELGQPQWHPIMQYVVFSAPFCETLPAANYGDMVNSGRLIAHFIRETVGHGITVPIKTAKSTREKIELARSQQEQGREGEVWFDPTMPYRPGKRKDEGFVRTKYLTEGKAIVVGLTSAGGNAYGSLELTTETGKPLGNVSCGSVAQRQQLEALFQNGPFEIEYVSQGYTETGILWHGRIHPQWIEKTL